MTEVTPAARRHRGSSMSTATTRGLTESEPRLLRLRREGRGDPNILRDSLLGRLTRIFNHEHGPRHAGNLPTWRGPPWNLGQLGRNYGPGQLRAVLCTILPRPEAPRLATLTNLMNAIRK